MQYKGHFITIEGIDGSGKSTLAKNLLQALTQNGAAVVLTKEPGGSLFGKQLRSILQTQPIPICDKSEYLLFAADRAQHYTQIILPALKQGKTVISDRWADSSVAYQGFGRGLDISMIKSINAWTTNNLHPDAILYVKIDAQTALDRVNKRQKELTAFEKERFEFWNRVIQGYEELYSENNNAIIIDGKMNQDDLLKSALEALNKNYGKISQTNT